MIVAGERFARSTPTDAEEQANCDRVSQLVEENSAPVKEALERLARERFGLSFSELSPEQVVQLALAANGEGRQMTAAQDQMQQRCAAYQQRQLAKSSAAGGFRSLFVAQGYLDRWGRERLAGLGCSCPDFQVAGEAVDHSCASRPVCPGQNGGPRRPDPDGGCRSIGAAAWIRQQLPEMYRTLAIPQDTEEVRDVRASLARGALASGRPHLPTPTAPPLNFAPGASRLRNEARLALRYLRMECRGL